MEPPQELLKGSNTADNRSGRVRSLYTAPILQRSPHATLEIMPSRAPEFSSARNFQEHNKTVYLPKDENKEGTGYRLLNMLRKTLKGSESKELEITPEVPTLVPFGDVVGCLAVHIKNCRHLTPRIILQHYSNLFIRISINNIVKCTKMRSLLSQNEEKSTTINFDDIKYFSVQVPRRQDDERNNIYLELMQYENTEKYPLLLGSVQVHLYDVIQKGCFIEEFEMLNKNTVKVEFMFSYGNFGYGFSHQLKPLQKIIEPSMFMNITPPPERIDPVTNVITPQPIEYPAFLSPDLNVTVGMPAVVPQSNQPSVVRLEKLQQQPRERLEKMKKEYRNLNTWIEKASYLEGVLNPKLAHKEHKEAETVPNELPDNDDKKGLTLPTLKQSNQDNSDQTDESTKDESTKQTDESTKQTPLPIIPTLTITEENKISPLEEYQSEAAPEGKMKNMFFPPEVKLKDRYLRLLKTDSSPSEVIFSRKEQISPSFRPEYIEFKPKYQDCSDRFEDIPVTSFKHAEQAKSRTRLLGKSPGESHNQLRHFARPNTAPEVHKRRESYNGRPTNLRMVSAGLVHINDAIPDYEIHKMRQKKKLKENIEKCSLICDIIQMLKVQNDM
uniref:C2 calcium dependent domain containing 6 n=1 Tax=Ursus maritimus TaxID=29073 RepID=A0A452V8F4_URSMA